MYKYHVEFAFVLDFSPLIDIFFFIINFLAPQIFLLLQSVIYPHLIGSDIGCGMAFVGTPMSVNQFHQASNRRVEQWLNRLRDLELVESKQDLESDLWLENDLLWPSRIGSEYSVPVVSRDVLESQGIRLSEFNSSLGTVGGGNHFAELQQVESIEDPATFSQLGLDESKLYLLVHSGSRGLGGAVLDKVMEKHGHRGIESPSQDAQNYLTLHDQACTWAKRNRALISRKFFHALDLSWSESHCVLDVWHNNVVLKRLESSVDNQDDSIWSEELWLHRKGAAPADCGPVVRKSQ